MTGLGESIALLLLAEVLGVAIGVVAGRTSPKHDKPSPKHGKALHRKATPHRATNANLPRLVAVASGVLAMTAPGAPTGWVPLDIALKGLLGAAIIVLSERVPTKLLLASSVIAVVGAMASPVQPAAALASGVLLVAVVTSRRQPLLTALSVTAVAQVALRMQRPAPAGVTACVAAVILGPIVVVGLWRLPSPARRTVGRIVSGVALFVAVAGALGVVSALLARRPLQRGVDLLSSAATVTGAQSGQLSTRSTQLKAAATSFSSAQNDLNAWWARGASAIPVVAQQMRALRTAASVGHDLSSTGATALGGVAAADIRIVGGQVPLDKLMALEPTLQASARSLHSASRQVQVIRSPWLLSPLGHRLARESARLSSTQAAVDNAVYAVPLLPDLLGGNGPRRYFLAVQTPSESRATGGLLGSYGEVTAENGHLSLTKFGHLDDLNKPGIATTRPLVAPPDYVARYQRFNPQAEWSNVNLSPDFPTDAGVIANLYPQSGGQRIDGVISIDPAALAAILRVVGPVSVPGWPVPITADNAVQILLHDEYATVSSDAAAPARVDFLNTLAQQAWSRVTTSFTGSPEQLLGGLSSAVAGKHLLLFATRPTEEALFRRLHAADAFPAVTGDFLGLVTQNAGGDKLDWFLHRQTDYTVRLNPATGSLTATVKVTLRNDAPSTGNSFYFSSSGITPPLPRGDTELYLSIYSPWNLTAASLGGAKVQLESQRELGRNVYSAGIVVPAESSVTLELQLTGRLAPKGSYHLDLFSQPTVNADVLHTSLHLPWGWRLDGELAHTPGQLLLDGRNRTVEVALSGRGWWW